MATLNDVSDSPVEDKTATRFEDLHQSSISRDTEQYFLKRHGTLQLDPLPSDSPKDPLNWPGWKKNTQLLMVAFHAMMNTFMAAGIIPGFYNFSAKYGTTIEEASYLTSVQVYSSPYNRYPTWSELTYTPDIVPRHLSLYVESNSQAFWP
jgi:hypothetical protein